MMTPISLPLSGLLFVKTHRGLAPVLRCQRCNTVIRDIAMAGVVPTGRVVPPFAGDDVTGLVLCKVNGCLAAQEYRHLRWFELRTFLMLLLANLGLTTKAQLVEAWDFVEHTRGL